MRLKLSYLFGSLRLKLLNLLADGHFAVLAAEHVLVKLPRRVLF